MSSTATHAPVRIVAYVARGYDAGDPSGNVYIAGGPCYACQDPQPFDPYNRREVPCRRPLAHAMCTVSNWQWTHPGRRFRVVPVNLEVPAGWVNDLPLRDRLRELAEARVRAESE